MKLDNFVSFGRPPSGKIIIQVMTEFVVSNNEIQQYYQSRLEVWIIRLFL